MSRQFSGRHLRERRVALGVRIEALACTVGRSAWTIQSYELGRTDPPATIVAALAEALDTNEGNLFADVEEALI